MEQFEWSDGSPVTYTNWGMFQPFQSKQKACGTMIIRVDLLYNHYNIILISKRSTLHGKMFRRHRILLDQRLLGPKI